MGNLESGGGAIRSLNGLFSMNNDILEINENNNTSLAPFSVSRGPTGRPELNPLTAVSTAGGGRVYDPLHTGLEITFSGA